MGTDEKPIEEMTLRDHARAHYAASAERHRMRAEAIAATADRAVPMFPDIVPLAGDEIEVNEYYTPIARALVTARVDVTTWSEFRHAGSAALRHYGCVQPYRKIKEGGGFVLRGETPLEGGGSLIVMVRPGPPGSGRVLRPPTCRIVKRTIPAYEVEEVVCADDVSDEPGVAVAEEIARAS